MTAIGPKECPNAACGGECHGWVGEDPVPIPERLICRDVNRASFVSGTDQLEPDAGFRLVLGDLGKLIEDDQLVFVEAGDGGLKSEFAPRDLQLLDKVADSGVSSAGEVDAPAVLDEARPMAAADGGGQMGVPTTGWPEPDEVGGSLWSGVSSQLSLATKAMTCALERAEGQKTVRGTVFPTCGTASKLKPEPVLPGGRRASAR